MTEFQIEIELIDTRADEDVAVVLLFDAKDKDDALRKLDLFIEQGRFKMRVHRVEASR